MTTTARNLASGRGWQVSDVICTAGVGDRPFEEQHRSFCVAAVTSGTFRYRTRQGTAMLAPGAILLGNPGACYECGHEHGAGDRCLSFHFAPAYMERIAAGVPGASKLDFATPRLPPLPALAALLAEAEAARETGDGEALEELGLRIAGAVVAAAAADPAKAARTPSRRDQKRVAEAVRLIEFNAERPLSLTDLANGTATSPYHFLRTFRHVAGMTPYQFLLRTRLHRAAVRLRASDEAISTIAFDAGFNDLSTFNRRFKREIGEAPGAYRARRARREG
ncbi:AraC family transcriptional regulator [Mesorhizobium sp. M1C.F.Ca.ET.193.01.1.1]|uniref:helix-turn-helix transcriptional regulator n=1 Tax=unclassified Mesorhizobium TaxID=325217 RepID=UPI000FD39AD9|nr:MULTISPECIES: AraC family transcriptional regulator [unclassified Mesorhizobium]TGT03579.1 AraC family transcriptional regulator [bacterium M00.F.Ca.ET.177.01.1.1]TGQ56264.1 AraC family transcriptional regulator [Mesorhizobium sp. M1C.F.Ca.ET.210.01.1.1]TGQ75350.1 AraC family transcriptional regulator [Mesorhizobium sp. M1C.F.Ca.ET.212.01.1.1]TGR13762.1 AraC family transcriptional regulator [Mesorhizobium sp. M1C.F.Ca.ET.204.01.1.1]TGR34036.1 AraC family transcriptional regulator [Mesorhizo